MPQDLADSVTGDVELIFPDDATGRTYRLQELSVYDADEVRDEEDLEEVPKFGSWIPVTVDGDEAWLNAPSQLRSELVDQNVEVGQPFTVDRLTKDGHQESDPYQAEISVTGDRSQDRLEAAGDD